MATRNYIRGLPQTATLVSIGQVADAAPVHLKRYGVLKTGLAETFVLYEDDAGVSPLPNDAYELTSLDSEWTARESVANGGTGLNIFAQFKVTNATYHGVPLYASFKDFGSYTDNDAPREALGVQTTMSATGTFTPTEDALRTILTSDTSGGANTITVDVPAFIGQDVFVLCDGVGLTDCDFPGKKATGNVVISAGFMLRLTSISLTEYVAVNEVTADYVSGTDEIIIHSSGNMEIKMDLGSVSTPTNLGSIYYNSKTAIFPVAFNSINGEGLTVMTKHTGGRTWCGDYTSLSTTQVELWIYGATNGSAGVIYLIARGKI
jgi:hypothetical protein